MRRSFPRSCAKPDFRFRSAKSARTKPIRVSKNFETVADCGGQAFIAFKSDATGKIGGLFEQPFHFFKFNQEEYTSRYHKRSNVESTFSAIKRKFGDAVRSKTDTAMTSEVLCKVLCHNLTCLIHEQEELGIVPFFWKDEPDGLGEDDPTILSIG